MKQLKMRQLTLNCYCLFMKLKRIVSTPYVLGDGTVARTHVLRYGWHAMRCIHGRWIICAASQSLLSQPINISINIFLSGCNVRIAGIPWDKKNTQIFLEKHFKNWCNLHHVENANILAPSTQTSFSILDEKRRRHALHLPLERNACTRWNLFSGCFATRKFEFNLTRFLFAPSFSLCL